MEVHMEVHPPAITRISLIRTLVNLGVYPLGLDEV